MPKPTPVPPPPDVDDDRFYAELTGKDPLGVVIRGLIYIDLELSALIEEAIYDPSHLKALKLDYSGRLNLAAALGLDGRFLPPLRALGSLRNRFAHQPNMSVSESDAQNAYEALSPHEKQIVRDSLRRVQAKLVTKGDTAFGELEPLDKLVLIMVALRAALRAGRMQVASSAS